ncbi:hypothetical protein [Quadrisphaera sp. KR29]|uniref:hypothetical protein n=1 Tax=Quadrisphaera sp. KR29 TaxID=3461391 RepID=UPI004043ED9E
MASTPRPRGSALGRGLAAGAVGTAVLGAVTHADMAWRGRPASSAPADVVEAAVRATGRDVPGRGEQRSNRLTALGALSGTAAGLATGVLVSAARTAGLRFSGPGGAAVTGAVAMAATDLPMGALGVSDPRTWTRRDWVADAVPHLAFGMAAHGVLRALEPASARRRRASAGLVLRSALLGAAAGSRSSLGLVAPALTSGASAGAKVLAVLPAVGELVADKSPAAPARTSAQGLPARLVSATGGAAALAAREGANAVVPSVAAAAGATGGAFGGLAWRRWASRRVPDWQAALVEDGVAVGLAAAACLTGRRSRRASTLDGPAPVGL